MKSSIEFGSKTISFQIEYSSRKTLEITVTPEMEVFVKAPLTVTPIEIKERVRKRAPWILKQLGFFLSFHPKNTSKKYVGGESHLYLGRNYRLRLLTGEEAKVKLAGGLMEVTCKSKAEVKLIMTKWYLKQAKGKFEALTAKWVTRFKKYHVAPENVAIRHMPTRWGSCTSNGKIILNPELIKAPNGCIEYVIMHELCHLVHRNHTQAFIDLQTKEMPDWEKWKEKLERLLA